MRHFIISYNNAFRIIQNLNMRSSASTMFVRARNNSEKMQIRKQMYSLLSRLYSSEKAIIVRSGDRLDIVSTVVESYVLALLYTLVGWHAIVAG